MPAVHRAGLALPVCGGVAPLEEPAQQVLQLRQGGWGGGGEGSRSDRVGGGGRGAG